MSAATNASAFDELLDDLAAETDVVRGILIDLPAPDWEIATPAQGWAVRDQVSHLAYFDDTASLAMTDQDRFAVEANELTGRSVDFANTLAEEFRGMPPVDLLRWFEKSRTDLLSTFRRNDPRRRVPWYGVEMSVMSSATARLMETWAHGVDVADAVGATIVASPRLRHIAHLGVRTIGFSFAVRNLTAPSHQVKVRLDAPDGNQWSYGPDDATDVIEGPALDFCFVVTQRRNVLDTSLRVSGDTAIAWMRIAQAFAGPSSEGRLPQRLHGAPGS
jgi:uncharacterized protein (TIGR03084 family)